MQRHKDDAETGADGVRAWKEPLNLLGRGAGGDVVILRVQAQEFIADASAGEVGDVPRAAEGGEDLNSRGASGMDWA
jgi:hypothetical protein